jgi:hypothetical protein
MTERAATYPQTRKTAPTVVRAVLIAVFFVVTMTMALPVVVVGLRLGWDAPVYTEAARAWLEGGNPWIPHGYAFPFAGPPPSFLPFLPFVVVPPGVTSVAWVGIAAVSGVYSLRKLGLPLWWLLFPPVSLAIMAGSSALLVTALLVRGGVIANGLAVVTRIYAAIPLLILGKWRSLVVAAGMLAVTLPMWPQWFAEREQWQAAFAGGAADLSAASMPWLIPFAILGLVLMGRERAAWLVVPVLWPDTQPYYAVIALPALVRSPFVALSLALPIPGLVVAGMFAQALASRAATPGARWSWRPARRTSSGPAPSP